jgi:hypothetical protein
MLAAILVDMATPLPRLEHAPGAALELMLALHDEGELPRECLPALADLAGALLRFRRAVREAGAQQQQQQEGGAATGGRGQQAASRQLLAPAR